MLQMKNHQTHFSAISRMSVIGFLMLSSVTNSFANDGDRITQLEVEVQQLKLRLTKLENAQGGANSSSTPLATSNGWKNLANWRSLKKGMSQNEVRSVLGEPEKVRASGPITVWNYSNRGVIDFYDERLDGWTEPR